MKAVLLIAAALLALSGCDQMSHQPRYDEYEKSPLFSDGGSLQPPPEGAVARDAPENAKALAQRPEMSAALLSRGQERYAIFCTPCHDAAGYGEGAVPARGFPHTPSFHSARLRNAPETHFVDVMTNGYGVMYSYAARVPPADRWAIAAYIRALQLSQDAPETALSADDRRQLAKAGK